MKRILLYGNCQLGAVLACMNLKEAVYEHIICHKTDISKNEFAAKIAECDILITQNIAKGYRNKGYLDTEWVVEAAGSSKQILVLDTCHFRTYFYDYIASPEWAGSVSAYSYKAMLEYIEQGKTVEEYINDVVLNEDYRDGSFLEKQARQDLKELERRGRVIDSKFGTNPNVAVVHIHDFVQDNYRSQLLFHSVNHPAGALLRFMGEKILNICKLDGTIRKRLDPLGAERCILYHSLRGLVSFPMREPSSKDKQYGLKTLCERYWAAAAAAAGVTRLRD